MDGDERPAFVSLFAGVGGFDLVLERAGFRCAAQVEINEFCQRILAARWPGTARWADVRAVGADDLRLDGWRRDRQDVAGQVADLDGGQARHEPKPASEQDAGRVDLLVGGFPCQDLSVAGKRAGLGGERSGLFWEIVRIAKILRPAWGIFENVPGLLSSAGGRDMGLVLAGLRECWPAVGYRVLDSRHFGVPQRRRRVFFVCGPEPEVVEQVLFDLAGGGGHPAAGGEAREGVAASLTAGAHGGGVSGPGRRAEDDVNLVVAALQEREANGPPFLAHALSAEGADASEDGTGRGTPLVIQDARGMDKAQNGLGVSSDGVAYTVDAQATQAVATPMMVRRLTPLECERLQGFPDGWTCLCGALGRALAARRIAEAEWRASSFWTLRLDELEQECACPDSARYRAMGNAVTVFVVQALAEALARYLAAKRRSP